MPRQLTRRAMIAGTTAAFTLTPTFAATAPAQLTPARMRADLTLLRHACETLHPGLLRYAAPARIAARFDAAADACARPLSLADFYLRLSRLLATIRCGHSYANFYNQKKAVRAALFESPTRLPFHFLWLGDRMIVTADPFHTGIAPGSEIVAIDGRPAAAILAALMPLARADGHNDAKRRRLLSVQGEDGYETFDVFHALSFGGRTRYRLDVRGPDGRRRVAQVAAITLEQRRSRIPGDAGGDQPIWTLERTGDAALLTMPNWALYDSKWDWRGWLDTRIDALVADRVPALIVDLRGNEGGQDCGDAIIARLVERPVVLDDARRLVRYRTLPADLKPYCDTWDRGFDTLGVDAVAHDDRFLELTGPDRGVDVIAPKGPRYTGKLFVLVGPQNSSATFAFAQAVQRERLGTLVGETTGGNRRGINGGCFYFFRLPETGLEADLPLIGTFPRRAQPDAGIVPDMPVPLTVRAIAGGEDVVLAKIRQAIG